MDKRTQYNARWIKRSAYFIDHTWLQMGKAASRRWLGADSDSRDTCSRDKTGTSRSKDTCKKAELLKSDLKFVGEFFSSPLSTASEFAWHRSGSPTPAALLDPLLTPI